jgi:hypothetical protein
MKPDPKPWYRSRTLWINALMLLAALASAAEPLVPGLKAILPERLYAWIAFALPLVNVALRFATTAPLCRRKPQEPAP